MSDLFLVLYRNSGTVPR